STHISLRPTICHSHLHLLSSITPLPPSSTLFPYTTLFRSRRRPAARRSSRRRPPPARAAPPGPARTSAATAPSSARRRAALAQEIGRAHSELQSRSDLVCRLLLEKKKKIK